MARFRFNLDTGTEFAAELRKVTERPIENRLHSTSIHLIRLEFEIFKFMHERMRLQGLGKMASRDIIIGEFIDITKDAGLSRYCEVLGVRSHQSVEHWKALEKQGKWIKIQLGDLSQEETGRNPFKSIASFPSSEFEKYTVKRPDFDVTLKWVRVSHAAEYLQVSDSTARRKADKWAKAGFPDVKRLTTGGQREINLPLLWDLEYGE